MNNWQNTYYVSFYNEEDIPVSSRHGLRLDVVVCSLNRFIKSAATYKASYMASEMDLSGWSELLWDELFNISFSDIGLASPFSPCNLFDMNETWTYHRSKGDQKSLNEARRILITCVRYLCETYKNRTVAHASMYMIYEIHQRGCIAPTDWHTSLGMGSYVYKCIEKMCAGHTPIVKKRTENFLLTLVQMKEDDSIRHADMLVLSGNVSQVWGVISLAIKYIHKTEGQGVYEWFLPYYGKYKKICDRYNRDCEYDKWLKGGHLKIFPEEWKDFREREDVIEYVQNFPKFTSYYPRGTSAKNVNMRRLNYKRKCVIQTVMLFCRGVPTGTDDRTPMQFSMDQTTVDHLYSGRTEKIEVDENVLDWSVRGCQKSSVIDARHWWVNSNEVTPIVHIPNNYTEDAFERIMKEEIVNGINSSEEYVMYKLLHSVNFECGITEREPQQIKNPLPDMSLFPEHMKDIYSVLDEDEILEDVDTVIVENASKIIKNDKLLDPEEIYARQINNRKKDLNKIENENSLSDMIQSFRKGTISGTKDTSSTNKRKKQKKSHSVYFTNTVKTDWKISPNKSVHTGEDIQIALECILVVSKMRSFLMRRFIGFQSVLPNPKYSFLRQNPLSGALTVRLRNKKKRLAEVAHGCDVVSITENLNLKGSDVLKMSLCIEVLFCSMFVKLPRNFISVENMLLSKRLPKGYNKRTNLNAKLFHPKYFRLVRFSQNKKMGTEEENGGHRFIWDYPSALFDRITDNNKISEEEEEEEEEESDEEVKEFVEFIQDCYITNRAILIKTIHYWKELTDKMNDRMSACFGLLNTLDVPIVDMKEFKTKVNETHKSLIRSGMTGCTSSNSIPDVLNVLFC